MSDYWQKIIENFSKYRIGLDDVFAYKCRGCGKLVEMLLDIWQVIYFERGIGLFFLPLVAVKT